MATIDEIYAANPSVILSGTDLVPVQPASAADTSAIQYSDLRDQIGALSQSNGYNFSDVTNPTAILSSQFRANNATPGSITELYLYTSPTHGRDMSTFYGELLAGVQILLVQNGTLSRSGLFTLTGPPVDNTSYWTFPVSVDSVGTLWEDGKQCTITFLPSAAGGATPLSVVDIDDPSTELNAIVGNQVGDTRLVYQADAADNIWTLYAWDDASSASENVPFTVDGSSGMWQAVTGRYTNGTSSFVSVDTTNLEFDVATLPHQTTPANPASGNLKIYSKNDDKVYTLDSAGTETELGSGGGGGGNGGGVYSETFEFADLTSGQITINHQLGNQYVDMVVFDENDVALDPNWTATDDDNLLIDFGAGWASWTGNYTVAVLVGGSPDVLVLPHQTTPSNPSAGNVKVYSKSDDKIYKLDSAGNEEEIGTGSGGGGLGQNWTAYTPTLSWTTNTTPRDFKYRHEGRDLHIKGVIDLSGAPNAANLTIGLPSGFTADFDASTNSPLQGYAWLRGPSDSFQGVPYISSAGVLYVSALDVVAFNWAELRAVTQSNPFTWGSGNYISIDTTVPVQELGSGVLNYGDRSRIFGTKYLQADILATDTDPIPDLTFTGLTIGRDYEVKAGAFIIAESGDDVLFRGFHDGNVIYRKDARGTASGDTVVGGQGLRFTATTSTVTFAVSSMGTGAELRGNGTANETWAQLIEYYEPDLAVQGKEWQDYTFSSPWTNTTINEAQYIHRDQTCIVKGSATCTGTPTGLAFTVPLPSGITADVDTNATLNILSGSVLSRDDSTGDNVRGPIYLNQSGEVKLSVDTDTDTYGKIATIVPNARPFLWAVDDELHWYFEVPVSERATGGGGVVIDSPKHHPTVSKTSTNTLQVSAGQLASDELDNQGMIKLNTSMSGTLNNTWAKGDSNGKTHGGAASNGNFYRIYLALLDDGDVDWIAAEKSVSLSTIKTTNSISRLAWTGVEREYDSGDIKDFEHNPRNGAVFYTSLETVISTTTPSTSSSNTETIQAPAGSLALVRQSIANSSVSGSTWQRVAPVSAGNINPVLRAQVNSLFVDMGAEVLVDDNREITVYAGSSSNWTTFTVYCIGYKYN